jgi:hypothetical protein
MIRFSSHLLLALLLALLSGEDLPDKRAVCDTPANAGFTQNIMADEQPDSPDIDCVCLLKQ